MDIQKLKNDILSFYAEQERNETGGGASGISSDIEGESDLSVKEPSKWRQELDDVKTAGPLSLGAALIGALLYDGVKNREEDDTKIFTDPWKSMMVFGGAFLVGWGSGRLARGNLALHQRAEYDDKLREAQEELESEKEDIEKRRAESRQTYDAVMNKSAEFELVPSFNSMNIFGEYGNAVGQSPVSYQFGGY